ncbi:hypothetical protein Tco_0412344 [Tanacetum coccineum]
MYHNLDQLRLQLERENLHGVNAKNCGLPSTQNTVQGISSFFPSKGLHDEILQSIKLSQGSRCSLEIQINPDQAMADSLISIKKQFERIENNNEHSSKS